MTIQEQAFRAYYGSMADAELLRTASHRASYIALAQQLMTEELSRRHLTAPPDSSAGKRKPSSNPFSLLTGIRNRRSAH